MLSELIFGKKLNDITLTDLEVFFSEEQEETSLLEFKSGGVLVDDIYKEVCAFLNTEGGVLIIGTPREERRNPTPKTEVTVCHGELTPTNYRGKDWLMASIISNISPPPTDIRIQEFHSDKGSHFIVEVPQSMTPPHQNNRDGKYYIRMERDARHAPHGVVEALFFKRQKADLGIAVSLSKRNEHSDNIVLDLEIDNKSLFPTDKVSYVVNTINVEALINVAANGYETNINDKTTHAFTDSNSSDSVLWKGLSHSYKYIVVPIDEFRLMPFVISVIVWSRDTALKHLIVAYDPKKSEFILQEDVAEMTDEERGEYLRRLIEFVNNSLNFTIDD